MKAEKPDDTVGDPPSQPTTSHAKPADTPIPTSTSITPAPVKVEPRQSPAPSVPTTPANKPLSISIPAPANGVAVLPNAVAAANPSSGTPAPPFATVAHIWSASIDTPAISPLSDVGPASKRLRTPEAEEEKGREKRQKVDHIADDLDQGARDTGAQVETEMADNPMADWDLEAQLQNILDSVPEPADDEESGAAENRKGDLPSFLLPPPRPRLEKMKYIENPTYFARSMGLPTLGSLVSRDSNSRTRMPF